VLSGLENTFIGKSAAFKRALKVYTVYGQRGDALASFRDLLPADAQTVGMITFDDPETSLWRPFGSRRVYHVVSGETRANLDVRGITYVLVSDEHFKATFHEPFEKWQADMHAEVVRKAILELRAGWAPSEWCLVKLLPMPPAGTNRL
jgi:hypothetical protein